MSKKSVGPTETPIPDTRRWQPSSAKSKVFERAFFIRCKHLEQRMLQRAHDEIVMNFSNFDSGDPVESILRGGLRELLPGRYGVMPGRITDSLGFTAGDCDVVVFNKHWFPIGMPEVAPESRRRFIPVDGVYAVFEIKQSLDFKSLDDAMEKIVRCKRLYRPSATKGRITENTRIGSCDHEIRNPLFGGVIATRLGKGVKKNDIFTRFVEINRTLPRSDVVNSLCILGTATLLWGFRSEQVNEYTPQYGNLKRALFMDEDLYCPLMPILCGNKAGGSHFYELVAQLITQLYHTVLAPEDVAFNYGHKDGNIQRTNNR